MSYTTAAAHLGLTEDAVRGRLRGPARLRKRLARRGFDVTGVFAAARLTAPDVSLPPALVRATVRAASSFEAGRPVCASMISQTVVSLSERTIRIMMLTHLRTVAAALVLGILAAGAVVLAQSPGGGHQQSAQAPTNQPHKEPLRAGAARTIQQSAHAQTNQPPKQSGLGRGGNFIVDWLPAEPKGGKREVVVDPTRHCIHLPPTNLKGDDRLNDCILVVSLEKGKLYTITASGEAFMTESTGADADPFPGVVVLYGTDEEDCYASRQIVMKPGKSITFRSPWLIEPSAGVSLSAFFLDEAAGHPKRGSYTLTIEEADDRDDAKRAQIEQWLRSHHAEAIHEQTKPRSDGP